MLGRYVEQLIMLLGVHTQTIWTQPMQRSVLANQCLERASTNIASSSKSSIRTEQAFLLKALFCPLLKPLPSFPFLLSP